MPRTGHGQPDNRRSGGRRVRRTKTTPSGKWSATVAATARAKRVLPTPPGPESVSSRTPPRSVAARFATSSSRPINDVSGAGRSRPLVRCRSGSGASRIGADCRTGVREAMLSPPGAGRTERYPHDGAATAARQCGFGSPGPPILGGDERAAPSSSPRIGGPGGPPFRAGRDRRRGRRRGPQGLRDRSRRGRVRRPRSRGSGTGARRRGGRTRPGRRRW